MRFGLFGSAAARRGSGEFDSAEGYRDFIEYNVEAEALGFHGTFVVEHHFIGFGQVSATLNLLTWLGARTRTLRLGTAVIVLPWHNPVLLAEQPRTKLRGVCRHCGKLASVTCWSMVAVRVAASVADTACVASRAR
jgi:Luciferase-like monooxygenase